MDSTENCSQFAILFTATRFALDYVLPEEYRVFEKLSYKNFLLTTTYITAIGYVCGKGKKMLFTSKSSPTLSSTLSESS